MKTIRHLLVISGILITCGLNAQQWPPTIPVSDATWGSLSTNNTPWTAPAGTWAVIVECWGAGGGGGGATSSSGTNNRAGGGGGGGGAYSKTTLTNITGGTLLYITAGLRGRAGQGSGGTTPSTDGGNSFVRIGSTGGAIICLAEGGKRGLDASGTQGRPGGAGGLASNGIGDVRANGGNGASGAGGTSSGRGGGGGGGAGDPSPGGNANNATAGTGGATGGGNGGNGNASTGASGGAGSYANTSSGFGGGGGGALSRNAFTRYGGSGHPGVVRITLISTLGVQLSGFTATCGEQITYITWTTSSEKDSEHFTLERSRDAYNWEQVTTVPGAGTTDIPTSYSVTDNLYKEVYYRLKQMDTDGTIQYYNPIYVDCSLNKDNFTVFPNPSSGNFAVEISSDSVLEGVAVVVYDLSGKQLLRREVGEQLKGTNLVYFSDEELAKGTYLVRIETEAKNNFAPVKLIIR